MHQCGFVSGNEFQFEFVALNCSFVFPVADETGGHINDPKPLRWKPVFERHDDVVAGASPYRDESTCQCYCQVPL